MSLFKSTIGKLAAVGTVGALVLGGAVLGSSAANAADSDRMVGPWVTASGLNNGVTDQWHVWSESSSAMHDTPYSTEAAAVAAAAAATANNYLWEMPKPGNSGPIVNVGTGNCATRGSSFPGGSWTFWGIVMQPCVAGAANQQWQLEQQNGFIYFKQGSGYLNNFISGSTRTAVIMAPFYQGTTEFLAGFHLMEGLYAPLTAVVQSVDQPGKSAVISGTGEPGATIVVTTPTGEVSTTVNPDGTWSVTAPGLNVGANTLPVRQEVDGETTDDTSVSVTIDAPVIAPLTAAVDSVDQPGKSAVISGTGEPGATIVVTTPTGEVSTTVNPDGTWSVTAPGLNVGANTLPVRQEVDGETTDDTTVSVTIDAPATAPVTAVVDSVDHDDKSAVISGTGEPGATIEIDTPTGTVTTTVDGDGTWSATAPGLAEGENELPVRQIIDGETTDTTTVTVIINVLNPPVAHPAMAGGALALALGGLLLHRRRQGAAA